MKLSKLFIEKIGLINFSKKMPGFKCETMPQQKDSSPKNKKTI